MQKSLFGNHSSPLTVLLFSANVPGTASIIPASLKQQPSAVDMSHFSAQDLLASHVLDHILAVAT